MARTYRLRHYPIVPGTARRFAFTHARCGWHREQLILATARRMFPDVPIATYPGPFLKGQRSYYQNRDAQSILDTLDDQLTIPLASPYFHPWRRRSCYGLNIRKARRLRIAAHRKIRRIAKSRLNHSLIDFDELLMPMWNEHWDSWDLD